MNLADKVAFIAGAAAKIGRASCLLFAREGPRVAALDFYSGWTGTLVKEFDCAGREAQLGGCFGTAENIAGAAPYLTSDDTSFVIGAAFSIDGGFSR
jgi:NAD(P)-dependent dehydrogenase (short-subunit alcohol dehydrogenase family)